MSGGLHQPAFASNRDWSSHAGEPTLCGYTAREILDLERERDKDQRVVAEAKRLINDYGQHDEMWWRTKVSARVYDLRRALYGD